MTNNTKIVVVGSSGHNFKQVDCYNWNEPFPNLADYPTVIMNLSSLDENMLPKIGSWEEYLRKMENCKNEIAHLLISKGSLYWIYEKSVTARLGNYVLGNLIWMPIELEIETLRPGTSFREMPKGFDELKEYLDKIKEYRLCVNDITGWGKIRISAKMDLSYEKHKLLTNRYGKDVCAAFFLFPANDRKVTENILGIIYMLHPPTEISTKEGIDILIKNILGKSVGHIPPKEADLMLMPGEKDLNVEINRLAGEIKNLDEKKASLEERKEELRSFISLLWEWDKPLEDIVAKALKEVGLSPLSVRKGKEDWVLKTKKEGDKKGITEVTGVEDSINVDKLRQLVHWMVDQEDKFNIKGILIGNHSRNSITQKGDTPFTKDAIDLAKRMDICLLTTEQLFKAVCKKMEGKLSPDEISEKICKTVGECKLV